jgi:hypothetical protein
MSTERKKWWGSEEEAKKWIGRESDPLSTRAGGAWKSMGALRTPLGRRHWRGAQHYKPRFMRRLGQKEPCTDSTIDKQNQDHPGFTHNISLNDSIQTWISTEGKAMHIACAKCLMRKNECHFWYIVIGEDDNSKNPSATADIGEDHTAHRRHKS